MPGRTMYTTADTLEMVLADVNLVESEADDVELHLETSSESEQSSDAEGIPPPPKKKKTTRSRPRTGSSQTANDGTVWRQEQLGTTLHVTPIAAYAAEGEPTSTARRRVTSRLQSFLCLVNLEMLQSIRHSTVERARMEQAHWFMALPELMGFIAIVIIRGLIKVPATTDYWAEDYKQHRIAAIMSRDRFQDIMRHLRFDDKSTRAERIQTDKFAPISKVWGSFVANCIASYTPGQHITVDEQLFPTKTRCAFLQYIVTKPDKFGIKFWVACDLRSKYICNVLPYLGKDPDRPTGERLADSVVMRLLEPFLDKGRNVTTDNFFTSLALARRLSGRKTTILGTINKIRRELPEAAKQADRDKYTTQVFSTTGATLTVYQAKPKKSVCILSSMHNVVETDNTPRKKPNTITTYNSTKCGVDVMDQMVREYSVRRGTRRWPVAVFYNMIDMATLNAHVLYEGCTGDKERRATFLMELAKELSNSHVAAKNAHKEQALRQKPGTPSPGKRSKCQIRHCKDNRTNKRCVGCHKYTCGQCIKEKPWLCLYC